MAATVWKGYISFGLVSIPVRLFTASRSDRVSFHMVHKECGTRIKQQLYCPHDERVVERSEIVKGYQVSKEELVTVEEEELKKIAPASSETMSILQFVKIQDVDPVFFDASYYLVPEDPGRRPYSLLLETMKQSGFAALAKVAMHQREHIVIIRPREQGMMLHTLYFPNEVRAVPEYASIRPAELKNQEIELAQQLVKSLAADFKPEQFEDEYRKKVLEMVEAKAEGQTVRSEPSRKRAPVIDLMAALQKSLEGQVRKPAATSGGKRRKKAS